MPKMATAIYFENSNNASSLLDLYTDIKEAMPIFWKCYQDHHQL